LHHDCSSTYRSYDWLFSCCAVLSLAEATTLAHDGRTYRSCISESWSRLSRRGPRSSNPNRPITHWDSDRFNDWPRCVSTVPPHLCAWNTCRDRSSHRRLTIRLGILSTWLNGT